MLVVGKAIFWSRQRMCAVRVEGTVCFYFGVCDKSAFSSLPLSRDNKTKGKTALLSRVRGSYCANLLFGLRHLSLFHFFYEKPRAGLNHVLFLFSVLKNLVFRNCQYLLFFH